MNNDTKPDSIEIENIIDNLQQMANDRDLSPQYRALALDATTAMSHLLDGMKIFANPNIWGGDSCKFNVLVFQKTYQVGRGYWDGPELAQCFLKLPPYLNNYSYHKFVEKHQHLDPKMITEGIHSECRPNPLLSCVCKLGTKCCYVNH